LTLSSSLYKSSWFALYIWVVKVIKHAPTDPNHLKGQKPRFRPLLLELLAVELRVMVYGYGEGGRLLATRSPPSAVTEKGTVCKKDDCPISTSTTMALLCYEHSIAAKFKASHQVMGSRTRLLDEDDGRASLKSSTSGCPSSSWRDFRLDT
jgi:hypothetical protein